MKIVNSWCAYIKNNLFHPRIIKFAIVGLSGLVINMGLLYFFTEKLKLLYWISSIMAIEISIISNFFLNDVWTWKDREKKKFHDRFIQYHISVGITAVVANWLLLVILTEVFHIYYLLSNLIGIAAGTLANFILNDLWTFGKFSPKDL